jgi:hypothetical protein
MLNLLGFLVKDLLEVNYLYLLVLLLLEEENLLRRLNLRVLPHQCLQILLIHRHRHMQLNLLLELFQL